ncbi:MAG: AMP-binding protein [Actinomycetota bacterium]
MSDGSGTTTASILESCAGGVVTGAGRLGGDALATTIDELAAQLRAAGAAGGPVCYLPPPGAAGALAFLAASHVGAAAPVHPKITADELAAYLKTLDPDVLVVPAGSDLGEVAAAGTGVATWMEHDGALRLEGQVGSTASSEAPGPDDVALILPTSGTTGDPKQVPLAHRQLCRSAVDIARSLQLGGDDTALTMMPLFHIHGLVAGLLAPLAAGGWVAPEPFDAFRFGSYLDRHRPTWFSAVPTMHALIVERWGDRRDELMTNQLRFARSSSSSLQPPLLHRIEAALGVPAVEAYGMTEASHQITSNPIEPGERRPGSVGRSTGLEVRIDRPDDEGRGEVLIRGPQVTAGYRHNDEANTSAFTDGWFRTGDEGRLDGEWLELTGRLKEMINRGGEKISPIEVELSLIGLEGVRRCAAFPAQHDRLGEEVAAVVVLDRPGDLDASEVRTRLQGKLAPHKIPRTVVVVDEIPLGPTGKVQRSRLAEQLGL